MIMGWILVFGKIILRGLQRRSLGKQPVGGDPGLLLSSQAPFHIAFYYESPLIYKVALFLKYSYLEYRLHLYRVFSQYAFQAGHPYSRGYCFLGCSIHYA